MSDAKEAAQVAQDLFKAELSTAVQEVISGLYDAFEDYRFYEADGRIYMEDDDGRFPAVIVCKVPTLN